MDAMNGIAPVPPRSNQGLIYLKYISPLIMPSISDGSFHGVGSGRKHGLSMIPAITPPMRSAAASTSRSLTCA